MPPMPSETLSTARPTPLRLAGFLALAVGAALAGIGATREWAVVGLRSDAEHVLDASWRGTDLWEGKVMLLLAFLALAALLAMRLSPSDAARRGIAIVLIPLGLVCLALPTIAAVRTESRFGGTVAEDRLVAWIAAQVEQPEDVVRAQFREELESDLRVDRGGGVWIAAAGGLLLAAGGLLSLAYVRRGASPRVQNTETV
jgi:hypothetical protein